MPQEQPFKSELLSDYLADFSQGENEGNDPLLLPKNQAGKLVNATVRGDLLTQRPPFLKLPLTFVGDLQAAFETGFWQGGAFYKDDYGNAYLAAAISGRLFLFTQQAAGFSVSEITIPGDPNPATVSQAWLWQSERWLIWMDGQSVPVFYDGLSSRRAAQGSGLLGTTGVGATVPAVASPVTLTLTANYTGPFNILVAIYDSNLASANLIGLFQTVSASNGSYQVLLTNESGTNQTVNTGDQVIVPATPGTTNQVGLTSGSQVIHAGPNQINLTAPIPANLNTTITGVNVAAFTPQLQPTNLFLPFTSPPVIGATHISVSSSTGNFGVNPNTPVIGNATNIPPTPSYPVGRVTNGPYNMTPGTAITVTLDTAYTGPAGATVTINGVTYTITASPSGPPASSVTVINQNAIKGANIPIGSVIRQVPELPPGRMGVYGLGRNWLSLTNGTQFVASDIVGGASGTAAFNKRDAVLRFQENTYLAGGGAFPVPSSAGEINAMIFMSNLDASLGQGPLMVHTSEVVFSCQAPVDRTTWQSVTNPILTEALKPRGGLSQKSTINANSDQLFRTSIGIQSLILGRRDFDVWGNVPQSFEVEPTIEADNQGLLNYSTSIEFDNRALMSANPIFGPNGVYHTKLIALDYAPVSSLRGKQPAVYDGIWTGINPFQLVVGRFGNAERGFAFCFNPATNKNELWEILPTGTLLSADNGTDSIVLDLESSILFHDKPEEKRRFKRMENAEIYVQEITDPQVTFETFYASDSDPTWHPWHSWVVQQTPSWQPRMGLGEPTAVSDPDTGRLTRDGYWFQFRLRVTGRCTLLGARFQASTQPEPMFAKPLPTLNI